MPKLYNAYTAKKQPDPYASQNSSVYTPQTAQGAPRSQMVGNKSVAVTGSTKSPQPYAAPPVQKKTTTAPPPLVKPPVIPPVAQPTAQQTYDQKYQNYLSQSQARKEQLALQNEAETKQRAQEEYDANKNSLAASQGNLNQMMSGFRERSAAGQARLDAQAKQNRERAGVASGESQRELAIARRQALNDNEKRYAALGTIDSMGTGSFQSANENKESDFLSLTAKNKQALEYTLQDIDNKLFDAKADSEERIATEEAKYNEAVMEINRLLAGNEQGKAQAIRAASQMLEQKRAEIEDEYEGLRITSEKEKYDLQSKLQAASMDDEKLKSIFSTASPDFLKTGQPKTAQDQFIIFKYPKEAEAYMKMLTDSKTMSTTGGEKEKLISLVNDISSSGGLGRITGVQGMVPLIPGSSEQLVKGQIEQLKALLSLEGRQKLKGSGAISDREMGILERASSLLNQNLNEEQTQQVLSQLKTELSTGTPSSISASGGRVRVIDIATGQSGTIDASEFDPSIYKKI